MDERIVKFISALRAAGVRVSLAESTDAFQALEHLGVRDPDAFRLSLRATLVKDARNLAVFEELYPLFFGGSQAAPLLNLAQDLTPEEAALFAQALQQFKEQIRRMLDRLLKGEPLTPAELERLGKFTGLNQANDLRYQEWMTQRLERALRFPEVRRALQELAEMLAQLGMDKKRVEQLQHLMLANQQALSDQLRQFAGQKIAENFSQQTPGDNLDDLLRRPFSALSDRDLEQLRREVQRLAAALRTRVALRQKRAKNGHLDAKATIRANLKHGNVPILLRRKSRTLKPRLVVICDISTSMRSCSELMLSLLYALQDQISKTYSFAFIDHLEFISPDFERNSPRQAVQSVLERLPSGYYNTDLGYSLENFVDEHLAAIDSRTTFLIVGDGRNNYNDPRLDLLRMLGRRSRRMIWINPEAPILWGTGDSDMLKYAPDCDVVLKAGNLADLISAVDSLLALH